jgi:hypothetical protein
MSISGRKRPVGPSKIINDIGTLRFILGEQKRALAPGVSILDIPRRGSPSALNEVKD